METSTAPSRDSLNKIPFMNLSPMHGKIRGDLDRAIKQVLDSEHYIGGPQLAAFEREFADYCGTTESIGVSNGLDALILILKALDIGPGDEVILPANSFIATALAVSAVGAVPALVDVDEQTFNIDPELAAARITKSTKAIIGVHLYGQLCDVDALISLCSSAKIHFIEDAAQAHGARIGGRCAGQFGIASGFSFYPAKNLGALGDAGAVVCPDRNLAERIRTLRNYGSKIKYIHDAKGTNNRLDELQAAILRVKLRSLEDWNLERRKIARSYSNFLANLTNVTLPVCRSDESSHVWHQYVVRSRQRVHLQEVLKANGIETLIHYPVPIHLQEAYKDLNLKRGTFEITESVADEIFSLPIWIGLDHETCAKRIRDTVKNLSV